MEVTALRAQLADLQEETLDLKNQIRKEVQEEYRELVQALFMTCLHIKVSVSRLRSRKPRGCIPRDQ